MRQDMARMPVRDLPIGFERVTAPWQSAQELKVYLANAERRGEITIHRPLHADPYNRGQVTATVQRHRPTRRPLPKWVVPAILVSSVAGALGAIGYAVKVAVDSVAEAVTHPSSEVVGFLVFLGLLLFALSVTRARGRIVEGAFRGRIR